MILAPLAVIAAAHGVLETAAGLGNVWSLESLRRWLRDAGDPRIETVKRYVGLLPEHLVRRFIAKEGDAVLVTGRLPDVDASQILPVVERIDKALEAVRKANPGFEIAVTGLPAIAARNSAKLIAELNVGLVGDMFIVFIFLAIVLRSVLPGVTSIMPSMLPIFTTGALLWVTGRGSAVRLDHRDHGCVLAGDQFDDPLPQPVPAGGGPSRRRPGLDAGGARCHGASHRAGRGADDDGAGARARRHDAVGLAVAAAVRATRRGVPVHLARRPARDPAGEHRALPALRAAADLRLDPHNDGRQSRSKRPHPSRYGCDDGAWLLGDQGVAGVGDDLQRDAGAEFLLAFGPLVARLEWIAVRHDVEQRHGAGVPVVRLRRRCHRYALRLDRIGCPAVEPGARIGLWSGRSRGAGRRDADRRAASCLRPR